ncbi:MAG: hypothetical protein R3B72_05005 [Polyangiaceae bacterium]
MSALLVAAAALVVGIVPWYELLPALASVLVVVGLAYSYLASLSSVALGERGRLAAAAALVGFAPVVGLAAQRALESPLMGAPLRSMSDATRVVLVALLGLSAAGVVAFWWATRRRAPRTRVMHAVAQVAVVSCGALVLCALVDARGTPSPETYADSLPMVASLEGDLSGSRFAELRPRLDELGAAGFALGRTCTPSPDGKSGGKCFVHVRRGERVRTIGPLIERTAALRLHRDDAAQKVVLVANGLAVAAMDAKLEHLDWADLTAVAIAGSVSAPRSFIALALTSLVGALMLLARRRQLERRLALVAAGRAGTVDASGWAHLEDGSGARRLGQDVAEGPVVLVESTSTAPPGRSAAYRSHDDTVLTIHRGARSALMTELRVAVTTADVTALSVVVVLSTPLVVAALLGLIP